MADLKIIEDWIPLEEVADVLGCCERTAVIRMAKAGYEALRFRRKCIGYPGSDLASLDVQAAVLGVTVAEMLRQLTAKSRSTSSALAAGNHSGNSQ